MKVSKIQKELHKLKRMFQKFGITLHKMTVPDKGVEISAGEKEAIAIVNRLVKDKESDLLTCPNTGKYYIKCGRKKMLIVIGNKEVNIINSVYSYSVHLSEKTETNIRNFFLDEVEIRRDEMEQEFTSSVKHSLKTIYQNLANEK
jgi:hypothetical protein